MLYWLFIDYSNRIAKIDFWLVKNKYKESSIINKGQGAPSFTKNSTAVFVLPTQSVLLTEIKWPRKLPIDNRTLIYALEDKLIEDPEEVDVQVLNRENDIIKIGVFNKQYLQTIHEIAKQAKLVSYQITIEVFLLPFTSSNQWSLWKSDAGLIVRYDEYLGICLPPGLERSGIDVKLAEVIQKNQAPQTLLLCEYDRYHQFYDQIDLPIDTINDTREFVDFLDFNNLISIRKNYLNFRDFFNYAHRALTGIYQPIIAIILVIVIAFLGNYYKTSSEINILNRQIDNNFYQIFSTSAVKTSTPLSQIENQYLSLVKKRKYNFSTALTAIAEKIATSKSQVKPQKIIWQDQILLIEFDTLPKINSSKVNDMIVEVEGNKVRVFKSQF